MKQKDNVFAERLGILRREHCISQYTLADRLGFSRGLLSNYEQGTRQPDFNILIKIADYFKVSTDYLLGVTEVRGRLLNENTFNEFWDLMIEITNLSVDSLGDLKRYVALLKLRDDQEKQNKKESPRP
jgi:transcriptional regulator with XRE-family HTH domain